MKKMNIHSTCLNDRTLINVPKKIPMILLNEKQAQVNHNQSLDRLNERGGLGVLELIDNIYKRKLTYKEETQSDVDELNKIIEDFKNLDTSTLSTR